MGRKHSVAVFDPCSGITTLSVGDTPTEALQLALASRREKLTLDGHAIDAMERLESSIKCEARCGAEIVIEVPLPANLKERKRMPITCEDCDMRTGE